MQRRDAKGAGRPVPPPCQTFREALRDRGWSQEHYANTVGLSRTELVRQIDGERKLDTSRIDAGPRGVAIEYHRRRLTLLEAESLAAPPTVESAHRRLVREVGDVSRVLDDALADGELDEAEKRELRRELHEVVEMVGRMLRRVE